MIAELFGIQDGPLREEMDQNILHRNGADHGRLRGLVNPFFTPRAARPLAPAMQELLAELWPDGPGEGDVVELLCKPYPSRMIASVMGAPAADAARLEGWSAWIQRQFDPPSLMADRPRIEQACAEFYVWCRALLEHRRATPSQDLVSALIAAEQDGDRLSDLELVHLVLNVLVGGVDTTQSQLAQAVALFAGAPEQWAALRADPRGLAPAAVAEVLRHRPITPFTARVVEEEVEHRGLSFPVGTVVMVAACAANREGIGDDFDITAVRDTKRSLTFGAGIHYCLGASLAKAELEEALVFLAERVEAFTLLEPPAYGSIQGIYGIDRLAVSWR